MTVDEVKEEFPLFQSTSLVDGILYKTADGAWRELGLMATGGGKLFANLSTVVLGVLVTFHSNAVSCQPSLMTRKAMMAAKDSVCHMESFSDTLLRKAKSATYEAKLQNASATNT